MRAVYAIRHQAAGVILSKLYLAPPSADEVERVRLAHAVPGREHWARVVALPIEVPEKLSKHFAELPAADPEPPIEPVGLPRLAIRATGTVTNP